MHELGIMGGAFNPPHNLHLLVAQLARDQFGLDKVLFIPSGNPPHKSIRGSKRRQSILLPKEARFELTEAAVAGTPFFQASRIEIDRPGVTWSIDTLYELKRIYGDAVRLNFIIGDDNITTFRDYKRRKEILSLCRLLVSPRKRKGNKSNERMWRKMLPEADMEFIDCPQFAISSTLVRDLAAQGKSVRYLVPPAVNRLIEKRRYFKS